jgi:GrpB-like predicted nucleotidyltransferase (UPF0157 family)
MTEDKSSTLPGANTPLTEEQIMAVTVGERQPLNGAIHLVPYDPVWPSLFTRLANQIQDILGDAVLLLEHVGSTSIPGLSAKPIIDLVLAVADSSDEVAYVTPLEKKGYRLRIREPEWYEHRLLKTPDIAGNLHVFSAGCAEIAQMLLLRDWLWAPAADRLLYEETKHQLAARTWKHTQNYADAKSDIVQEILARARSNQT